MEAHQYTIVIVHCNCCIKIQTSLVLAHLFVKIPPPGDSKLTFSIFVSTCHLVASTCLNGQH